MRHFATTAALAAAGLILAGCGDGNESGNVAAAGADNGVAVNESGSAETSASAGGGTWPAGTRIVEEDGVTWRVDPDGTRVRLDQGGARIVVENGVRYRVDPGGARFRIDERGIAVDLERPDVDLDVPATNVTIRPPEVTVNTAR